MDTGSKNKIWDLMMAASKGDAAEVQSLLDSGAQIDAQDVFGNTALIYAAAAGHLEIVELLLRYGARADIKNQVGVTAAMRAAAGGFARVVESLERKQGFMEQPGAYPLTLDDPNRDRLVYAVPQGDVQAVTRLLSEGADVEAKTRDGQTPLLIATAKGDRKSTRLNSS